MKRPVFLPLRRAPAGGGRSRRPCVPILPDGRRRGPGSRPPGRGDPRRKLPPGRDHQPVRTGRAIREPVRTALRRQRGDHGIRPAHDGHPPRRAPAAGGCATCPGSGRLETSPRPRLRPFRHLRCRLPPRARLIGRTAGCSACSRSAACSAGAPVAQPFPCLESLSSGVRGEDQARAGHRRRERHAIHVGGGQSGRARPRTAFPRRGRAARGPGHPPPARSITTPTRRARGDRSIPRSTPRW